MHMWYIIYTYIYMCKCISPQKHPDTVFLIDGQPQHPQFLLTDSHCPNFIKSKLVSLSLWSQPSRYFPACYHPSFSVSNLCFLSLGVAAIFNPVSVLWICQSHLSQIKPSAFSQSSAWTLPWLVPPLTAWALRTQDTKFLQLPWAWIRLHFSYSHFPYASIPSFNPLLSVLSSSKH